MDTNDFTSAPLDDLLYAAHTECGPQPNDITAAAYIGELRSRIHYAEVVFACPECGEKYTDDGNLAFINNMGGCEKCSTC